MHFRAIISAAMMLPICATIAGSSASLHAQEMAMPTAFEAGWKGEKVCEPLFENEELRAARCTFPVGVGHERHFHPRHWGYIVQGTTMRITKETGTVDRVLKTGSNWWSDGIKWHEAVNVGTETGIYIIMEPKK